MKGRRACTALLCTLAFAGAVLAPVAGASPTQESSFQDDNQLIFSEPASVARTLDTLAGLGVDRLRVSVFWKAVAPQPGAAARPAFDAADPAAYPPGAWDRYDTLLRLAAERGLRVNLDITGPAPNWATGTPARTDIDETYEPSPDEFGQFVRAVGRRFPGVDYWSIWNEPNHPGWLTPQWQQEGSLWFEAAPRTYRALADAAYAALADTGHGQDTILVGETAPKGTRKRGLTRGLSPARFIRQLYCLDDNLQFLVGSAAQRRGCPTRPDPGGFVAAHPALFHATGWAHHPYELTFAPTTRPQDTEWFTIANLGDLSRLLRRVRTRYGQAPGGGGVPLYLTEFGYQTNPPDPLGVTPQRQASYLALAEYLAWSDPHVRTLSQFLLVDDGPPVDRTFQSGLETIAGEPKPALDAYKMPVILTTPLVRRGSRLRVWGLVRPAATGARALVDVLVGPPDGAPGTFRKVATARANARGYVIARVPVQRRGQVRLAWRAPDGTTVQSRAMSFHVRRR